MPDLATIHWIGDEGIQQGVGFYKALAPEDQYGVRIDYTGWTATFTIYGAPATLASLHDAAPAFAGTSADGAVELGLFDGGEFGEYGVLVSLAQGVTATLEPIGRAIYILDLSDPFGHVQLRIKGAITIEEGTTHA